MEGSSLVVVTLVEEEDEEDPSFTIYSDDFFGAAVIICGLQFSIQNLQTGSHLKDLNAKVTIFNDPIYKYDNITVTDGGFSIRHLFLDSGMHQVILKVATKDYSLALASFNISVL